MFDPLDPATGMTAMEWTLDAVTDLYRDLIRKTVIYKAGKRNGLGVVLYDTRQRPPLVFPNDKEPKPLSSSNLPTKEEQDDEHYYAEEPDEEVVPSSVLETVHELVPLDIADPIMLKRLLDTLPDNITQERRIDIQAEYAHKDDDKGEPESHAVESFLRLPIYKAIGHAKSILDTADCVRQKPTKVKGKVIMPPDSKQIWIITNLDSDPCHGREDIRVRFQERLEELREAGVNVFVWQLPTRDMMVTGEEHTMSDTDHGEYSLACNFVPNPFFTNVGMIRAPESEASPLDREQFTRSAFRLNLKLRPSFSVPLLLPDWKKNPDYPGIQVDLYKIVKRASKPTVLRMDNVTGRKLVRITNVFTKTTLEPISESVSGQGYRQIMPEARIRLFGALRGGEKNPLYAEMQPSDLVKMKKACNANPDFASLILIGFKPRDRVRFSDSTDVAYFMFPQESKVEGSGRAFASLLEGMKRKNVLAMGEILTRVSATSRLVAFWPIVDGAPELAPQEGMVMVYLPFQDEIRSLPKEKDYAARFYCGMDGGADDSGRMDIEDKMDQVESSVFEGSSSFVSSELVDATGNIIKKLTLLDRQLGVDFVNAYLTEFYKDLERTALGIEGSISNDYDTILTEERKQATLDEVGKDVEVFESLLPEDTPLTTAGKRKSTTSTANPGADDTGIDWNEDYDEGRIEGATIPQLKKYCEAHGLKKGGKKAELVERVTDHIIEQRKSAAKIVKTEPIKTEPMKTESDTFTFY